MESKVTIIIQEMLPLLNNEQLLALRESLERHLVDGKKKQKYSVNNYEQGYLRLKLGNLEEAESYMQESLDFALTTEDFIAQACSYRGMGEIYLKQGSVKSRDYFYQSIQLFEKAEDKIGADEVRALLQNEK